MMRRLAELLSRHRRQAARVVLMLAVLVVAFELLPQLPRDTDLEFTLGPRHGEVVELRVAYLREGAELYGVSFHWDEGAPAAVRHSVELPSGEFELRCELRKRGGGSRTIQRRLITPAEGLVRVRLGDSGETDEHANAGDPS